MTIIISIVAYHGFDYVIYNFFNPILTRQPDAYTGASTPEVPRGKRQLKSIDN